MVCGAGYIIIKQFLIYTFSRHRTIVVFIPLFFICFRPPDKGKHITQTAYYSRGKYLSPKQLDGAVELHSPACPYLCLLSLRAEQAVYSEF